jgi:hypothetical protein
MSDTTLYSSLYQQISEYAEQVDEVLVALVTHRHDPALFRQMAETLKQIVDPVEGQLANRMIAEMIFTEEIVGRSDLEMAVDALETDHVNETTRDIIERLARSLEQERTKAMARIRGERR